MVENDEIYLKDIIFVIKDYWIEIKRKRWLFASILMIIVAISMVYTLGQHAEYQAQAKLLPYKGKRQLPGGLGGIAGLAGINLSQQATDQVIPVSLYKNLIETVSFRDSLALIPLRFLTLPDPISFYDYMSEYYQPSFNEKIANFPGSISSLFSSSDKIDTRDTTQLTIADTGERRYSGQKLGVLSVLKDRISLEFDEMDGVLEIKVSMPDNMASLSLANAVIQQLSSTVTTYELQKLNDQLAYIESQYLETRASFIAKQRELAAFQDGNRGLISASARIKEQHLQNEYDLSFEIFRNLANQREQVKLKLKEDSPLFVVFEEPFIPNKPYSPKPVKAFLISLIIGSFVSIIFILVRYILRSNI